jgi:hypothetical protein
MKPNESLFTLWIFSVYSKMFAALFCLAEVFYAWGSSDWGAWVAVLGCLLIAGSGDLMGIISPEQRELWNRQRNA